MSDGTLPADWPHSSDGDSAMELLSMYSGTGVFRKALESGASRPLKFYLPSFNNKLAIVRAIKDNGGEVLQHKNIGMADFIIKPTRTQIHRFSTVGVVCTPHLILKSLQAGRMLDADDFLLKEFESDESNESESDIADHQLEVGPGATARDRSRTQSPAADDEPESVASSQQAVETPQRQQRQQQQRQKQQRQSSRLSLTPGSSAIADIRYLYPDDDELDPDDRYVHEMLSSRSRSIEDLVIGTADSPGSQRSRSVDISDNDFRVKAKLDATARDPREMLDLALIDSPADSLANSPASSPRLGSKSPSYSKRVDENERPKEHNRAPRTPSPQLSTSPPPQQTPSRSVISRIRGLFWASRNINASPSSSPSASRQPSNVSGRKLRSPKNPVAINTQYSQGSNASSSLSMEGTPERSASPELVMPPSQAPLSPEFAYIQLPDGTTPSRSQAPASPQLEPSQPRPEIGLQLTDLSEEEYPSTSLSMTSRVLRSESPELSSLPSASHETRSATREISKATQPPTPYMAISSEEEEPAPPVAKPAEWTGLGKRRRTSDKGSGYGHRPLPIVIEDGGDDEPAFSDGTRQPLFLSQQQKLPIANKSQSMDSLLATPTTKRIRMRVVPFSPSKRIRMSTCDSPEAASGSLLSAPPRMNTDTYLAAAAVPEFAAAAATATAPNGVGHTNAAVVPAMTTLAGLARVAAPSWDNEQPSGSLPPASVAMSGTTATTTGDLLDHGVLASTEPARPKLSTMPTESTASTVSTPALDSPSRRESDTEELEVATAPPSEPLVISGLFANQDAAAGSQLEVPHGDSDLELSSASEGGEILPSAYDAPQIQPVPESPPHHSDSSGELDDAENDADDDASDGESVKAASDTEQPHAAHSHTLNGELTSTAHDTPEPSVDPAISHEGEQVSQQLDSKHISSVPLSNSRQASEQAEDDFWRNDDTDVLLDPNSERTPQIQSSPGRARPATLHAFKSPARMSSGNACRTPEALSKTQPRATRSRRASTLRIVSTCQRLLMLHNLGDSGSGLSLQFGDGLLGSRTLLGSDTPESARLAPHDISNAPSPSRRAQFSGAMRVFGEAAPEMNDSKRLGYLRKLKGLMVGTSLTPKQAIETLYRCTGDWVIARKLIVSGEASVPSGCVWSAEDDLVLQQGMDLDRMEELRQEKGNVEVYRRLQFLDTFHGPKE